MKKLLALLLALAMCLSMFACGETESKKDKKDKDEEEVEEIDIDELDEDELEEYIEELEEELEDLEKDLEDAEEDEDDEAIEELEEEIKAIEKKLKKAKKALGEDEEETEEDEEETKKPSKKPSKNDKEAETTAVETTAVETTVAYDDWWYAETTAPAYYWTEDAPVVEEPGAVPVIEPDVEYDTVGYYHWKRFSEIALDYTAEEIANAVLFLEVGGKPLNQFMGGVVPLDGMEYFPGFDNYVIKGFEDGAIFMPMMGSIAYVGYIFELEDSDDAEDFIEKLYDNANPRWQVCVTADQVVAGAVGNMVFFIMCPSYYEVYVEPTVEPDYPAEDDKIYRIASDYDWAPFEYFSSYLGRYTGFDVDIMAAIAKDQDISYTMDYIGYTDALEGTRDGNYDGAIMAIEYNENREDSYDFSDAYFFDGIVLFDDIYGNINTFDDLRGKTIGITSDNSSFFYDYTEEYGFTTREFQTVSDLFTAINNNEVEAGFAWFALGTYENKENNYMLTIKDIAVYECGYVFMVPDGENATLIQKFNQGLANIIASGEYDEICEKYGFEY